LRRELIRLNRGSSLAALDQLGQQLEYLPITTAAMRRAAELWATARRGGMPTGADATIDADAILAAQALTTMKPWGSQASISDNRLSVAHVFCSPATERG
jgi:predicted nucleic acid-binding protein